MTSKERMEWGRARKSGCGRRSRHPAITTSVGHTPRICEVRGTVYRMDDGSRGSCMRLHMRGRKLFMYLASRAAQFEDLRRLLAQCWPLRGRGFSLLSPCQQLNGSAPSPIVFPMINNWTEYSDHIYWCVSVGWIRLGASSGLMTRTR